MSSHQTQAFHQTEIILVYISTYIFSFSLGTWLQKKMDALNARKGKTEEYLTEKLNFRIFSFLKVSLKSLKRLKRIVFSYLDLITDSILLGSVMTVVQLSIDNFLKFESQIAVILLSSIVVPLMLSAMKIAINRPFAILDENSYKSFKSGKKSVSILKARAIIMFCFPIVPALIMISDENAKEKLKSLRGKNTEDVKATDLEMSNELYQFIDQTR